MRHMIKYAESTQSIVNPFVSRKFQKVFEHIPRMISKAIPDPDEAARFLTLDPAPITVCPKGSAVLDDTPSTPVTRSSVSSGIDDRTPMRVPHPLGRLPTVRVPHPPRPRELAGAFLPDVPAQVAACTAWAPAGRKWIICTTSWGSMT